MASRVTELGYRNGAYTHHARKDNYICLKELNAIPLLINNYRERNNVFLISLIVAGIAAVVVLNLYWVGDRPCLPGCVRLIKAI